MSSFLRKYVYFIFISLVFTAFFMQKVKNTDFLPINIISTPKGVLILKSNSGIPALSIHSYLPEKGGFPQIHAHNTKARMEDNIKSEFLPLYNSPGFRKALVAPTVRNIFRGLGRQPRKAARLSYQCMIHPKIARTRGPLCTHGYQCFSRYGGAACESFAQRIQFRLSPRKIRFRCKIPLL